MPSPRDIILQKLYDRTSELFKIWSNARLDHNFDIAGNIRKVSDDLKTLADEAQKIEG